MSHPTFLAELEPVAARLLDRHLASAKEWFPHELVPWSRGRDFDAGDAWSPDEVDMPDAVRSSLFVNLLTEDNLPYYFRIIEQLFGDDGAWGTWVRRWTAEEGRHAIVIRDYLTVTRADRPGARSSGPGWRRCECGQVPDPEHRRRRARLRRAAGAGHPHRPSQHRQAPRRPRGL